VNASSQRPHPAPADVGVRVRERRRRPRLRALAVGVAATIILAVAALATSSATPTPTGSVAAAVTGYADQRLPGTDAPAAPAPDLGALGLLPIGASSGQLAGQHVTAYAYRDATGRRIFLYLSDQPFPMPRDTDQLTDQAGAWTVHHHKIVVLCARTPHEVLIIGTDTDLVHTVATTLDLA
jgi:hypothetical protein